MSFFSDGEGEYSMYRLCLFLWCGALTVVWTICSLKNIILIPIDSSVLYMTGIFVSGKIGSALIEAIPSPSSSVTKTVASTTMASPQTTILTEKTVSAPG